MGALSAVPRSIDPLFFGARYTPWHASKDEEVSLPARTVCHSRLISIRRHLSQTLSWRKQGRSDDWRHAPVLAMDGEGSLLMGGYKTNIGSTSNNGRFDVVVIKLNTSTGKEEDWRWEVGACGTGP